MNGTMRIVLADLARPKPASKQALKSAMSPSSFQDKLKKVVGNEKQPLRK
jgi:hypothetical protein